MSNQQHCYHHHHYHHHNHRKYPKYHHHGVYRKRSEASHAISSSLPLHCNGDLSSSWLDAQKGQRTSTLLLLQYNTTGLPLLSPKSHHCGVNQKLSEASFSLPLHCNGDLSSSWLDAQKGQRTGTMLLLQYTTTGLASSPLSSQPSSPYYGIITGSTVVCILFSSSTMEISSSGCAKRETNQHSATITISFYFSFKYNWCTKAIDIINDYIISSSSTL